MPSSYYLCTDATHMDDSVDATATAKCVQFFDGVDVLDRSVDIHDLVLNIEEDDGPWCGPLLGCCRGCFKFWCLCQGAWRLCFPHESSSATIKIHYCMPKWMRDYCGVRT